MLTGGSAYTKAYAKADRESHSYARAAAEIKDACILTRATKNAPRHRKKTQLQHGEASTRRSCWQLAPRPTKTEISHRRSMGTFRGQRFRSLRRAQNKYGALNCTNYGRSSDGRTRVLARLTSNQHTSRRQGERASSGSVSSVTSNQPISAAQRAWWNPTSC